MIWIVWALWNTSAHWALPGMNSMSTMKYISATSMNARTVGMRSVTDTRKWPSSTDTCVSDRRITNALAWCSQELGHFKASVALLVPKLVVIRAYGLFVFRRRYTYTYMPHRKKCLIFSEAKTFIRNVQCFGEHYCFVNLFSPPRHTICCVR